MLTLSEHILAIFGAVPDGAIVPCPNCQHRLDLFAIVRTDDMRWRCAHCLSAEARAQVAPYMLTWDDIRGERCVALEATDKYDTLPYVRASLTSDQLAEIDAYRQAWRDITDQTCEPGDCVKPEPPAWLQPSAQV